MRKIAPLFVAFVVISCSEVTCDETVTDIEGNTYRVVRLGSMCWMANNLRTSTYANGDPIPNVPDDEEWPEQQSGAWAHYENDSSFENPYGKLYNWYAVDDPRGLCPEGWRVPTDEEWTQMTSSLGENPAGQLKKTGTEYWAYPNLSATNETGFSALPTGYRSRIGVFFLNGNYAYIWSSSESSEYPERAWRRGMMFNSEDVVRFNSPKILGFSVRCVQD